MMVILTTVILKPLIMLDLWLGIIDISNTNYVEKDRQKFFACSIPFSKSVELVHVTDKKKEVESFLVDEKLH